MATLGLFEVSPICLNAESSNAYYPIFQNVQSTLIGQVAHLYPDPSSSSLITRAPEMATLRLSVMRDASQWDIIRDTKKNTFLSGFSKIGGLWTFLSGIFAAIFGSSLIRILFGALIIIHIPSFEG